MQLKFRSGVQSALVAIGTAAALLGLVSPAMAQSQTAGSNGAPTGTLAASPTTTPSGTDLTKTPTLYEVGYTHLDTEWCWTYPQVINEFIKNTLDQNFALFDKYPDYVFNWTGANRYKFMKEYYPDKFARLKTYVAQGRWVNTGSSLEEGDVCMPSEESIIRHVLYGNEFFKKEFNSASTDFILPDCFGFPASLPSILAHCGLNGFSTQKLDWGSAERTMGTNGIPFNLGVWVGPDGQGVFAALNGRDYTKPLSNDASNDDYWIDRLNKDGATTGFFADYNYYGVGDRGGSVRDSDAANLEKSIHGTGPVHVVSARSDQVFNDLEKYNTSSLPRYKGDLLLTYHNCGSATSQAEQKRWNHENEKLADATERASVTADWLGALPYDKDRITDAWWKFLPGQFHDLMAGTALPLAYVYAWNDQVLALNEFAGQLQEAVGGVTRALDTEGAGVPIVVYNPLSIPRQDVVEAAVDFHVVAPSKVEVVGPGGTVVPSQIVSRSGDSIKLLFLASAPSVGYSTFRVQAASQPNNAPSELKVSNSGLENARFRVALNSGGDVTSIFDKIAGKELLSAALRLSFQHENPAQYPAWNMDWSDQSAAPEGYVDGPAKISVVESGPVRVGVQVDRWARGSHFIETIRLSAGKAGDRVEFANSIDWKSTEAALKVYLPLSVSNPLATYNWELGTIQRSTDDPLKYEVPAHQWFDLTDSSGKYGVSVLSGDRYGSDKPDDHTLRLTLLYTPGVRGGFTHQKSNDWGHHDLTYAIAGHTGNWVTGGTQWTALRFDRPLIAFQASAHPGALGKSFSFIRISSLKVSVEALKQAEYSHKIVVRFNELAGESESNVLVRFAGPVIAAEEVNGQEAPIGPATIKNGALVFDMQPYRPRAFALTLAAPSVGLTSPESAPLALAYNVDVAKPFGSSAGGTFDSSGNAIPGDLLPSTIVSDGVKFKLAAPDARFNAVESRGQKIALRGAPEGAKLYLIAASANGDVEATFTVGAKAQVRKIQAWNGYIGQWDNRRWGGVEPELTYNMTNPLTGLVPGFIKRDTVAWYADHIRGADGVNQVYNYCYLYRYVFDIPVGATALTLPNDPRIKVLAATVAVDPNSSVVPVQPLYDTLGYKATTDPSIDAQSSADGASTIVSILPPLYFDAASSVHYTLDGSNPTTSSAVYVAPIALSQNAHIEAAYIDSTGSVVGGASLSTTVEHPNGPTVNQVTAPTLSTVVLDFSEPVSKSSAEDASHYSITPTDSISSASLASDEQTVTLGLANPLDPSLPAAVSVAGVKADLPDGLPVSGPSSIDIPLGGVVFQSNAVQSFDGSTDGFSQDDSSLPTASNSPWTINLFVRLDSTPRELTTLAGFGDDRDNTGTQRYLVKFHDGIHFWGSGIDVTTGVPYDIGKWQMVTATFDGKNLNIYKNGKLIKTDQIELSDCAPVAKIAPPGPWPKGNKLSGKIAGFKIWSRALSADELSALVSGAPIQ